MSLLETERRTEERAKAVHNERVKLTASYVNAVAGGVFTVGGLGPIFAVMYGATAPVVPVWTVGLISLVCWIASATLTLEGARLSEGDAVMNLADILILLSVPTAALILGLGAIRYAKWADQGQ